MVDFGCYFFLVAFSGFVGTLSFKRDLRVHVVRANGKFDNSELQTDADLFTLHGSSSFRHDQSMMKAGAISQMQESQRLQVTAPANGSGVSPQPQQGLAKWFQDANGNRVAIGGKLGSGVSGSVSLIIDCEDDGDEWCEHLTQQYQSINNIILKHFKPNYHRLDNERQTAIRNGSAKPDPSEEGVMWSDFTSEQEIMSRFFSHPMCGLMHVVDSGQEFQLSGEDDKQRAILMAPFLHKGAADVAFYGPQSEADPIMWDGYRLLGIAGIRLLRILHLDLQVVHRDIHPNNFMYKRDLNELSGAYELIPYLIDYGKAAKLPNAGLAPDLQGLEFFCSPRLTFSLGLSPSIQTLPIDDLWSLGLSLIAWSKGECSLPWYMLPACPGRIRFVNDFVRSMITAGIFTERGQTHTYMSMRTKVASVLLRYMYFKHANVWPACYDVPTKLRSFSIVELQNLTQTVDALWSIFTKEVTKQPIVGNTLSSSRKFANFEVPSFLIGYFAKLAEFSCQVFMTKWDEAIYEGLELALMEGNEAIYAGLELALMEGNGTLLGKELRADVGTVWKVKRDNFESGRQWPVDPHKEQAQLSTKTTILVPPLW